MDNKIKKLIGQSLSGEQMRQIDPKLKVVSYHELDGYSNLNQLLGKDRSVCILYESEYNSGHYTLLMQTKDKNLEFMDAYGQLGGKDIRMDDEISYTPYTKDHLHGNLPRLTQLVRASKIPCIISHHKFQKMSDNVADCGRHCAFRHLNRNLTLDQYAKLLLNKPQSSDYLVTKFTEEIRNRNL